MSIIKKLIAIQSELNAPKDQYNSFGRYGYRSAEGVLIALKPLLLKHELCISINDEIEVKEGRFYVKSTVTLEDVDGNTKSVTAYAREEETKKGMDGSQVTGASSSYAKKYALNNLFAIDDAKDSDATNTHGKDENKAPQATTQVTTKTESQVPQQPTPPTKPKETKKIEIDDETFNKSLNYLVEKGLSEWPTLSKSLIKNNFEVLPAVEAELLKKVGLKLKSKTPVQ